MITLEEETAFQVVDYLVFVGMLCVSTAIGLFYAWKDRKNTSNKEFLTSNRSLSVFPVAMSLLASFQSSVTILSYPAEMFYRGTQFWMVIISGCMAAITAAELFLPVYYNLHFTSVNQYLSLRFRSEKVRLAASLSFLLATVPYMGVVLYGPSLALGSVTPLSVPTSIILIGTICTFYTSIGGIKAVVWTDVVQVFLMFGGLFAVMIRGFTLVGGIDKAFEIASKNGRLQFFNMEIDPYSTSNFWNAVLGMGIMWCGNYCTSQTEVQRYCNVRSKKKARIALYANLFGMMCLISAACLCGVSLYAYYSTCDPYKLRLITKTDQLMPYFVMDQLRDIPGMPGLFVACVFSASLSTMSSGFNALAAVTWDDFLSKIPCVNTLSDRMNQTISKLIALSYGLGAIGMAFLVAKLESVLQAAISLAGALIGPTFGLYMLGILCPFANAPGVLCGLISGEIFGLWLLIGSILDPPATRQLNTSIDTCPANLIEQYLSPNSTHAYNDINGDVGITRLYHVAFLLVPVFGFVISLCIGSLVSLLTGGYKEAVNINPDYLSPLVWKIWPPSCLPVRKRAPTPKDDSVLMNGSRSGSIVSHSRIGNGPHTNLSLKKLSDGMIGMKSFIAITHGHYQLHDSDPIEDSPQEKSASRESLASNDSSSSGTMNVLLSKSVDDDGASPRRSPSPQLLPSNPSLLDTSSVNRNSSSSNLMVTPL